MANIMDVSRWFLSKDSMSPKKIQKLCYYFVAWGYALLDKQLVDDDVFEAWVHGPVSKTLYKEYREYGWQDVPNKEFNSDDIFDEKSLDLLESVYLTYGDLSANELEALTHTESPWQIARQGLDPYEICNKEINTNDMKNYYKSIYIGE